MAISKRISRQELVRMYEFVASQLVETQEENKRYKDALEYYANECNYEDHAPISSSVPIGCQPNPACSKHPGQ